MYPWTSLSITRPISYSAEHATVTLRFSRWRHKKEKHARTVNCDFLSCHSTTTLNYVNHWFPLTHYYVNHNNHKS